MICHLKFKSQPKTSFARFLLLILETDRSGVVEGEEQINGLTVQE
jgi:hypothetical protein